MVQKWKFYYHLWEGFYLADSQANMPYFYGVHGFFSHVKETLKNLPFDKKINLWQDLRMFYTS